MFEAMPYRNELGVVINEIIATKILLQYMIFIGMIYFVAKTYYHNLLQRLKPITTEFIATINFRCDKSLLQQNESYCNKKFHCN